MTATRTIERSVEALVAASRRNAWDPWNLAWPGALDDEAWCMSPELVSLHGTDVWNDLDDAMRRRLARAEAVNFFSLNIHGERILMEGIARRLHQPHLAGMAGYLHHFLDEENKHSAAFATFCNRYGGGIYPDRKMPGNTQRAREEADFLFFAQVVVFEEIVDVLNVEMARDERLAPIVREINARHHADESRHLAFGRAVVAELAERADFDATQRAALADDLAGFLEATWREYVNPSAYRDAGLADPFGARQLAWHAPDFVERRRRLSRKPLALLADLGFALEDAA